MKSVLSLVWSIVVSIVLFTGPIAHADRAAYPEQRIGLPGELWSTITARRKGPANYSSKVIGTPIRIQEGDVIQSVWFLTRIIDENSGAVIEPATALINAVVRAGIATESGFRANPLASLARDLSHNLASNSGVGIHPVRYSSQRRKKIVVTTIPELPGFALIGIELDSLWKAPRDQTVYAWANIEYTNENYLAQVFQYEDESGRDLLVNQQAEATEMGFTSMIWLEQGEPFSYAPEFEAAIMGSRRKHPSTISEFKADKLFVKRPYTVSITGTGGAAGQSLLAVYAKVQGTYCPAPIASLKSDDTGRAYLSGISPRAPRRRVKIEFELRSNDRVVHRHTVRLIRRKFRKAGRLRQRQKLRICDKLTLEGLSAEGKLL